MNSSDLHWLKQKKEEIRRMKRDGYDIKTWDATRFLRIIEELKGRKK